MFIGKFTWQEFTGGANDAILQRQLKECFNDEIKADTLQEAQKEMWIFFHKNGVGYSNWHIRKFISGKITDTDTGNTWECDSCGRKIRGDKEMKKFNGYDEAKKAAQAAGGMKLPVGAYVCKIMGVRYEEGKDGNSDQIVLQFDILEGEQKDFFRKQYEANDSDDKKWKGTVRIYVPKDDGSEKDGWTKRSFAGWMDSFEKSNSGYLWDWDETKLKGKIVGIVFGETGTVISGKEVKYTEARFGIDVARVRDGSAPEAKFKAKNGYGKGLPSGDTEDDFMKITDGIEDLPF